MLDQLLSFLAHGWRHIAPWKVVPVYQTCGVLRLGKYHRTITCGFNWKWPVIDDVIDVDTVVTTLRLKPQTCTTKDGKSVVVCGIVKYQIINVEPYIKSIWDQKDVMTDVAMSNILTAVRTVTFDELYTSPPENKVAAAVRREVKDYGFDIIAVRFTDLGQCRSLRLIGHNPATAMDGVE